MKKADFIFSADWHLRESTPICRTDNYEETQWEKVDFIAELADEHECGVYLAGDLFDFWKPSPYLLSGAIKHLPKNCYTVCGQHDLPGHSMEMISKSGVYTLMQSGHIKLLPTCHWGQTPEKNSINGLGRNILVWHKYAYQGEPPFPGAKGRARSLLYKYPQFDIIVTGDNHIPFVQEYEGRILVNCGSLMRQDADQIDYKPAVWLYYAETNTVEPVYLPIREGVISREHIEEQNKREKRIDAFISTLDTKGMTFLSFEKNLEIFMETNTVRKSVKEIIYKMTER